MSDLDSQLHNEQFHGPDPRYRRCVCGCEMYSYHDPDYKAAKPEWAGWSYSCQIRGEVALERAKYEEA